VRKSVSPSLQGSRGQVDSPREPLNFRPP
jgi:hypothetical protein